jgi:type IV pilus assembly protein PilB
MDFGASSQETRELLLEILLKQGKITEKALESVYSIQQKEEVRIEKALVMSQHVSGEDIASAYADHFHVPMMPLDATINAPEEHVRRLLPDKFMRDALVVPLYEKKRTLHVALADPSDLSIIQDIQLYSGLTPVVHVAPIEHLERALENLLGVRNVVQEISLEVPDDDDGVAADVGEEVVDLDKPIMDGEDTQIIRMVNHIIRQAILDGASDIHIEPLSESVSVRYRIDGQLQIRPAPPKSMFLPLLSRIKIISKMDIAEKRLPQDGACSVLKDGQQIDLRVSTVPTIHGQKTVMRILNRNALPLDHAKLGFDEQQQALFHQAARAPHGLVFVTGPTGSGKSTTLYATLKLLHKSTKNIVTVEDPVEYKMDGINQVQTHASIGLTFAGALRSFLRQDPDVIMVGEVRDQETAEICMRAALTGHLVLSTLHTNSALAAIDRLVDMGIEPFMVASTLQLVEAQRLIRRLCLKCKEPDQQLPEVLEKYHLPLDAQLFKPKGCPACNNSGYKGRVGVFEVILVTPVLRSMIQNRAPLSELQAEAERTGMPSLVSKGLDAVRNGLTSLEEVVSTLIDGGH